MPVVLDTPAEPARQRGALVIGLLNNLGDAGMAAGERQWIALLDAAAGSIPVVLRLFSLASISREHDARRRMNGLYRDGAALTASRLDGLIVTGAEPQTADLRDEPFWPELAAVIDWAQTGTRSTIWSCLAAHAAALHLDGIMRRRLPAKCTGVFDVERIGDHPLIAGAPRRMATCHSRWNDLDETELVDAGYEIVTRGAMGVDIGLRERASLFVLLQGHPEYDDGALLRELRRDLTRWYSGDAAPPTIPANTVSAEAENALRRCLATGDREAAMRWLARPLVRDRRLPSTLGTAWLGRLAAASHLRYPPVSFREAPYRTTTLVPTDTRP